MNSRNTAKISRGDMLLMLLLSHQIQIKANHQSGDLAKNSEQSFLDSDFTKKERNSTVLEENNYQNFLVFLQSINEPKLLVPYIYRKLTIEGDLFLIILSEVLLISTQKHFLSN
jgi:hypothetical protein